MHAPTIEDEPLIAMGIENILREEGYASFAYAGSADDAVAEAQNRCPDLITSDVALKPGNGIDAVEQIRSVATMPMIFVTSRPTEVEERLPDTPGAVQALLDGGTARGRRQHPVRRDSLDERSARLTRLESVPTLRSATFSGEQRQ